jgi:hypothetical protein
MYIYQDMQIICLMSEKSYQLKNDSLIEVYQPYYFVGIESILIGNTNIYSDTNYSNIITSLMKGTSITVLINKNKQYLVKTPFGLVGWIKVRKDTVPGYPIMEIYYKGD